MAWVPNAYQRRLKLIDDAVTNRGIAPASTFEVSGKCVILADDELTFAMDGLDLVVAVPDEILEEAGWVDSDRASRDREDYGDERAGEAYREATDNILDTITSAVADIEAAAFGDRLDDVCSSTDLLLHGDVVAAVRSVLAAVLETVRQP